MVVTCMVDDNCITFRQKSQQQSEGQLTLPRNGYVRMFY